MAIYHILSVFRNLQWSNMAARSGDTEQFLDAHKNSPQTAHNPAGHSLGIIGLGNIGLYSPSVKMTCADLRLKAFESQPRHTRHLV